MKAAEENRQREEEEEKRKAAEKRREEKRLEREVRHISYLMDVDVEAEQHESESEEWSSSVTRRTILQQRHFLCVRRGRRKNRGNWKDSRSSTKWPVNTTTKTCCYGEDWCHGNASFRSERPEWRYITCPVESGHESPLKMHFRVSLTTDKETFQLLKDLRSRYTQHGSE